MPDSVPREHRTASRVTTILETAAQTEGGVRLAALANALGAPKSSVHGLVKGLVATGYLFERDGLYSLGPAIDVLLGPARPDILIAAHHSLEELQKAYDESAMLCMLVGASVVYVDLVESTQMIRYSAPLNQRRPLYPTSAGKCFLAHFSPRRQETYLREQVPQERHSAVVEELAEVRQNAFAINKGETVPDVYAVASPIIVAGRVIACLAIAGPHVRMSDKLERAAEGLRQETARLAQGRT